MQSGDWQLPFLQMRPCLLYADDSLFFMKPEVRQAQAMKILFTVFRNISGLAVSMEKSELLLSSDDNQLVQQLTDVLGCKRGSFPLCYLGLPLSDKALPKTAYIPLLQKINNKLQGWAARQLSIAGRLVLINAVLSAIPTYFMSVFKMPAWVIQEIDKTRRKFL